MTCIVGIAHQGRVVIGGDSAGVGGWDLTVRADSKVFRVGPFVMGFTTSFRMGQLLRFKLVVPEQPESMPVLQYMATLFVDAVRQCLKDGGYAKKENEVETGGSFLVGYRGEIFTIDNDYQVGQPLDGFDAVGCGAQIARGALWASREDGDPAARATLALQAAERFSAGVRGPFRLEAV